MKILLATALLIVSALGIAAYYMGGWQQEVLVAPVQRGTAVDAVTGTVRVHAMIDIHLKSERDGTLTVMDVAPGSVVAKGDRIAALDTAELEQRLAQVQIRLEAAQARSALPLQPEISQASILNDLERLNRQVNLGSASQADIRQRELDLQSVQTNLAYEQINREEQLKLLQTEEALLLQQLEDMVLTAPWPGEVAEVMAWPGEFVWRGSSIARLVSQGRWIEMTLAEEDFYGVAVGQTALINLAAYPGERIEATVTRVAQIANADQKTRNLILETDLDDDRLVPGLTGEGVLSKSIRKDTLLIPRRALIGQQVYVLHDGVVEIREVRPGFVGLQQAEILQGLAEGELVILEDQALLQAGDTARSQTIAAP